MRLVIYLISAAALAATACTHTVNLTVEPDFESRVNPNNRLIVVEPAAFSEGSFADKRADTSMLASFSQSSHTYQLYADRPVRDILFEGLSSLLRRSGHKWSAGTGSGVAIDMQLLNIHAARHTGFISIVADADIQIQLSFVDARTKQLLYSQVYNGAGKREVAMFGTMTLVREAIDDAIIDCINRVGDDQKLAEALQGASSRANQSE